MTMLTNTPVQETQPILEDLNSRKKTAAYLQIPSLTLQFWASTKEGRANLPYYKIGRHAMYKREDILAYIETCRVV